MEKTLILGKPEGKRRKEKGAAEGEVVKTASLTQWT